MLIVEFVVLPVYTFSLSNFDPGLCWSFCSARWLRSVGAFVSSMAVRPHPVTFFAHSIVPVSFRFCWQPSKPAAGSADLPIHEIGPGLNNFDVTT